MPLRKSLGSLFFISGMLGLLMEQVFEKMLSTLLGASMPAASIVLAVYFLGLSLGSLCYAPWIRPRLRNPFCAYAAMEGGIALWGFLLYGTLDQRFLLFVGFLRAAAGQPWTLSLARGIVALCWILPPTFCMGATFPAIVDALKRMESQNLGRSMNRFYGLNLGGAIAGTLVGPYAGFPFLGLDGVLLAGAILGSGIALTAFRISKGLGPAAPAEAAGLASRDRLPWLLAALSVISGFVCFGLEVVWTHLIGAVLGNSIYAFAGMLCWVLIGLGLGAWIMARLYPGSEDLPVPVVSALLGLSSLAVAFQYLLWPGVPGYFHFWGGIVHSFGPAELIRWLQAGRMLLLPATLHGMIYPALFRTGLFRGGDSARRAGRLSAFNALGCIFGALITGFWMIPRIGSGTTLILFSELSLLSGILLAFKAGAPRRLIWAGGGCLLGMGLIFLPAWNLKALTEGTHVYFSWSYYAGDNSRIVMFQEDTRGGMTTVVQTDTGQGAQTRTLLTNGKFQGNDSEEASAQIGFALIPSLHLSRFDRALVIGLGTGHSCAIVQSLGFKDVDVAEIAPGILQAAKIWFPGLNRRVLEQPNVHVFLEDGRNELLLNQERYDLITMELSSVWFAGVSSLYSRDFYALAKGRLRPGGVLQQWIQIHHLRPEVLISTVRTLRSVFPFVSFWVYGGQGILVASEAPQLLQPGAMAQAGRLMEDWQKGKAQATELQTLLKSRLLTTKDVDRMYREFPTTINTDRNCYLEYASPKENLSKLPYQDINIKRLKAFANQP